MVILKDSLKLNKFNKKLKKMPQDVCLFLFRRDFRLDDNIALLSAIDFCKENDYKLITGFVFTPEQINSDKNKYFSHNSVQFMITSLKELNKELYNENGELLYYFGTSINFIHSIHKLTNISLKSVFFNKDYTPYSISRDKEIEEWCIKNHIECFYNFDDYTLLSLEKIKTGNGDSYKMYSPFYKKIMDQDEPDKPQKFKNENVFMKNSKTLSHKDLENEKNLDEFYQYNKDIMVEGGRKNALNILKKIEDCKFKKYKKERDYPHLDSTTKLSAYIKYGCVSIREVYWAIRENSKKTSKLISELYWREFYANITYHYPHVLRGMVNKTAGNAPMRLDLEIEKSKKNNDYESIIKWKDMSSTGVKEQFKLWCEGKTGFPIVDAGMRQMNKTGYMHNRLRMIVSNFLMKDLHIDWREGERYFATKLVDYDPCSNNGGWQWSSSTGTDSQPYFRTFNPWTQNKKYDKDCLYIKKWIKELKDVPSIDILKWNKNFAFYTERDSKIKVNYPEPMLDHSKEIYKTKNEIYSGMKKKSKN